MFINYLVHKLFECVAVHELALVHELSEFMAFREQPKFMNYVRVREQNTLMNSCIFMKVSFVVQNSWVDREHI